MDFHNINLPKFIEVFAVGCPEFATSCASTISGREIRRADRDHAKQKYLLKNCRLSRPQFEQFNSFFLARKGQNFAFRFRDPADYQANRQLIATGDNVTKEFPLFKLYDDPVAPYCRRITKPAINSVAIYVDNQAAEAEINYDYGVVIFQTPLRYGQTLTAEFTFDVPVRFGSDSFEYCYNHSDGAIELSVIELIEVKNL